MSKNLFNSVKMSKPNKNVFDLTHDVKLSLEAGNLVPTLCMECVPGDKFNIGCEALVRVAPMVAPLMHRMDVYMHYFFVPYRLAWEGWEDWITNTETGGFLPSFPYVRVGTGATAFNPLMDYLGIPDPAQSTGAQAERISAFPFWAYQRIWMDYYRDQNLIPFTKFDIELVDGDNSGNANLFALRKRAWEHDYFTAALPFAQKGAAVSIPLGTFEDVPVIQQNANAVNALFDTTGLITGGAYHTEPSNAIDVASLELRDKATLQDKQLYAETSSLAAGASPISDLRKAFKLQEWLEKAARGGSRYVENIFSFFGVKSPDSRLQRPEYITGTKAPIIVSEVLNTSGTFDPAQPSDPASPPQGNMAGHGVSVTAGKYGNYFCQEHGYIMGIMSILPKTAYQQGLPKHFIKGAVSNDPFEFYWPQFAHIGEQAVLNKELFAYTNTGADTFGYVPRYAEYKFMQNRVAGDFRDTLNYWHMGRLFATQPTLSQQFVEADPRTDVFAVTSNVDHYYAHVLHKIRAVRPMPKFGNPTF